jgi:hypothetical protein
MELLFPIRGSDAEVVVLGSVDIFLQSGPGIDPYFCLPMSDSPVEWWKVWFFLRNDANANEDINTSATIIPSVEVLGPITRSREQQLNQLVNSFLCSSAYNIESRLLPNDLIILRNQGGDHGGQMEHQEGVGEPRRRA